MRLIEQGGAERAALSTIGLTRADIASLTFDADPGLPFTATVPVDSRPVTIRLHPSSVRAPGFRVLAQLPGGDWTDIDPGPVRTYAGTADELPGALVAASLTGDALTAQIIIPGLPGSYWVEPAADRVTLADRANDRSIHLGYWSRAAASPPGVCAADTASGPMSRAAEPSQRAVCGNACVAELACDADAEYFNRYGSIAAVQARIEHVISQVNLQYTTEVGIRHQITTILVRTDAASQPYTTNNAGGLLVLFRNTWNAFHAGIPRDTAQLFTGKTLASGVLGIANRGTVCDPSLAYSVVASDCCGTFATVTDLSAHELGHTWNAVHCPCQSPNPASTMNAALTGANTFVTDISGQSVASITAWRDAAACLDPDTAPEDPPGAPILVSPADGAFAVPTPTVLDWTDAPRAHFYVVTVATDPDLINTIVYAAAVPSTYTVPLNKLGPATRAYWAVEAWDDRGRKTPWSSGISTFITAPAPPACPGDLNLDHGVDTSDLAILLGFFGQVVQPGTVGDLNGDAAVNTTDLILLLPRFGQPCP